ncbi:hypothetical protein [Cumulibacter soli]|uniref:hypothetical protein n=1 Tax=Cumulibacter soli TaxID=2546344 RepID=UPI0010673493|nr:hypothetical protein [Cumulibacter soli]
MGQTAYVAPAAGVVGDARAVLADDLTFFSLPSDVRSVVGRMRGAAVIAAAAEVPVAVGRAVAWIVVGQRLSST